MALLEATGLGVMAVEHHDGALAQMLEQVDARLTALGMLNHPALASIDIDRAHERCRSASRAVADGAAGYALIVAEKPAARP